LALGLECAIDIKRLVNVDDDRFNSLVERIEPLVNVRVDALARPAPGGPEF